MWLVDVVEGGVGGIRTFMINNIKGKCKIFF